MMLLSIYKNDRLFLPPVYLCLTLKLTYVFFCVLGKDKETR